MERLCFWMGRFLIGVSSVKVDVFHEVVSRVYSLVRGCPRRYQTGGKKKIALLKVSPYLMEIHWFLVCCWGVVAC